MLSQKDLDEIMKGLPPEQQKILKKGFKGEAVPREDEQVNGLVASIDDLTDGQLQLLKKELVKHKIWDRLNAQEGMPFPPSKKSHPPGGEKLLENSLGPTERSTAGEGPKYSP